MERIHYINLELVKALMKAKGFDEKEMAKQMNVTTPTIKKFLGGANQRYMSSAILVKLSIVLDVTMQSLLQESNTKIYLDKK